MLSAQQATIVYQVQFLQLLTTHQLVISAQLVPTVHNSLAVLLRVNPVAMQIVPETHNVYNALKDFIVMLMLVSLQ